MDYIHEMQKIAKANGGIIDNKTAASAVMYLIPDQEIFMIPIFLQQHKISIKRYFVKHCQLQRYIVAH